MLISVKFQASACNFTEISTPPWVFSTLFKWYKWYQIKQNITNENLRNPYEIHPHQATKFTLVIDGWVRQRAYFNVLNFWSKPWNVIVWRLQSYVWMIQLLIFILSKNEFLNPLMPCGNKRSYILKVTAAFECMFVSVLLAFRYLLASRFKVSITRFVINEENKYRGGKIFAFWFGNSVLRI